MALDSHRAWKFTACSPDPESLYTLNPEPKTEPVTCDMHNKNLPGGW